MKKQAIAFYFLSIVMMVSLLFGCAEPSEMEGASTIMNTRADTSDEPAKSVGVVVDGSFEGVADDVESLEALNRAPANHTYYFAFDDSEVNARYLDSIKAQARFLLNHPNARLRLEGHTDERGSREYNISLGWGRAKSVAWIIKKAGISSKQIAIVSYGKERPVDASSTPRAWQKNRRVELVYERQ